MYLWRHKCLPSGVVIFPYFWPTSPSFLGFSTIIPPIEQSSFLTFPISHWWCHHHSRPTHPLFLTYSFIIPDLPHQTIQQWLLSYKLRHCNSWPTPRNDDIIIIPDLYQGMMKSSSFQSDTKEWWHHYHS